MKRSVIIVSLGLSLLACSRMDEASAPVYQTKELIITAYGGDDDINTKTARQANTDVYWSPGDAISLFFRSGENGGSRFVAQNTEEVAITQFKGTIDVISGGGEDTGGEFWFWGIYPYSTENSCDGSSITTVIPAQQTGKAGTFADNTFITMARAKGLELGFYNICSGVKFTLSRSDIKEVRIHGNNGEDIAGKIKAEWDANGKPAIREYVEGAKEVRVIAPDGGTFASGADYYLVFAPALFTQGFTMSLITSDYQRGDFVYGSERQFKRGIFVTVPDLDTRVGSWTEASKALLPNPILPEGVDKATITQINFYVSSEKETEKTIGNATEGYEPIYFEQIGTEVNYYTKGELYEFDSCFGVFRGWRALKCLDLTNIKTSRVADMGYMFTACTSLKTIAFGDFDTANVERMEAMFADCWSLESLDLSGFITNKVTNMKLMFAGCSSLKALDLSSFDTSEVMDMTFMFGIGMYSDRPIIGAIFVGCNSLESLDLHTFNTSKVVYMNGMFRDCLSLKSVNVSGWDTSKVENFNSLFSGCASLESVDVSSFDTQKVTQMGFMFENCASLKSLDLSYFNTSNVVNMDSMFYGCDDLQSLDIHNFTASSLSSTSLFLNGAQRIKKLDLGSFDISTVDNLYRSFQALAFKSKSVAIRCTNATKQVIETLSLDEYAYMNMNYVTWVGIDEPIPDLPDVTNPDLYYSVDFSMDKKVKILQTATEGNGVDIVIMGDEYSDRLIADGTYESDMIETIDAIFDVEPMKSYKNLFNVYMVYAVSENETCDGGYGSTALGVYMQGYSGGLCKAYIKAASNKHFSDIATIVVCHDPQAIKDGRSYVITTYGYNSDEYYDYGQAEQSVAFLNREDVNYSNTVVHEFGHLFAKLADEYVEKDEAIGSSNEYEVQNLIELCQHTGAYKNIDFTNNLETIKWSRFLNDARYINESIGAFEGGHLYAQGVWRPTEHSIMRESYADIGFNAPSREAIYHRIHKLAYGEDWQFDYETFVQQDLKNISPALAPTPAKRASSSVMTNKKHIFKMEESVAHDGRKMVTVIMD